jgi:uncharacterized protein YoxC
MLDTLGKEKESLLHENETLLRNGQVQEMRLMELSNQIVGLVREKEAVEETLRQLQREVASKDREREEAIEKAESLQGQSKIQKGWMQEREVMNN